MDIVSLQELIEESLIKKYTKKTKEYREWKTETNLIITTYNQKVGRTCYNLVK